MARTSQPTDSLELLLDAICNTFGAILFIALLVVILLQQAGRTPQTDTSPERSPAELARLEHELDSLRDRVQQLRERQQSRQQLAAIVVQYGRMYLCSRYAARGTEIGPNLDDFLVLSEKSGTLRLTPKPTAGTVLNDSPECRAAILRLLRPLSPEEYYLAVIVRPDSYGEFHWLCAALVQAGFKHRLIPATEEDRFYETRGVSANVQ